MTYDFQQAIRAYVQNNFEFYVTSTSYINHFFSIMVIIGYVYIIISVTSTSNIKKNMYDLLFSQQKRLSGKRDFADTPLLHSGIEIL